MIIGISGKINIGKDYTGKLIQRYFHEEKDYWEIKKYATKLKKIASILTGYPEYAYEDRTFKGGNLSDDWGMSVREFLQKLGTEGIRNGVHPNAWVNALFSDYKPTSKWIITDVRFINEAKGIKDRGGVIIRIAGEAPTSDRYPITEQMKQHPSETELDDWEFDYVIYNMRDHIYEKHVRNLANKIKSRFNEFKPA